MITDKFIADRLSYETRKGYWKLNNHFFFNKAECLRYATEINRPDVTFHYYDFIYDSLDWSTNPNESLEHLYKERAQQLRDKYDYLILCFSGGSDSTNVLDTFLKNNIKLDEIVTYFPITAIEKLISTFNKNDRSDNNTIFEYIEVVRPRLQKIESTHPDIKITVIDNTEMSLKMIQAEQYYKIFMGGIAGAPNTSGQYAVGELAKQRQNMGNVACITGIDKPRLVFDSTNKKYGMYFMDSSTNFYGSFEKGIFKDYEPVFEHFYLTYDLPKLTQKQCFEIKNNLINILHEKIINLKDLIISNFDGIFVFNSNHDIFKRILYNSWDLNTWQSKKQQSLFYQGLSNWMLETDLTDNKVKEYFTGQVNELTSGINENLITYDSRGRVNRLKSYSTKTIWF